MATTTKRRANAKPDADHPMMLRTASGREVPMYYDHNHWVWVIEAPGPWGDTFALRIKQEVLLWFTYSYAPTH